MFVIGFIINTSNVSPFRASSVNEVNKYKIVLCKKRTLLC